MREKDHVCTMIQDARTLETEIDNKERATVTADQWHIGILHPFHTVRPWVLHLRHLQDVGSAMETLRKVHRRALFQ